MTECYRTSLCIRHPPRVLVLVSLALAADFFKTDLQSGFRFDPRSQSTDASSILSDPEEYESEKTGDSLIRPAAFLKKTSRVANGYLAKRPPEILRPVPAFQPRLSTPLTKFTAASSFEKEEFFQRFGSCEFFSAPETTAQLTQTCLNFHLSPIQLPVKMKRHRSEIMALDSSKDVKAERGGQARACKQWYHVFGDDVSLELVSRETQAVRSETGLAANGDG